MSRSFTTTRRKRVSKIDFHASDNLARISNAYPKLIDCVWEGVQNGIDPCFEPDELPHERYKNRVDLRINKKLRRIWIRDNGAGVSIEDFEQALREVGRSQKRGGRSKLGQFGMGAMSPFDKCEYWTFASAPVSGVNNPTMWTFDCEALKGHAKGLSAPQTDTVLNDWWNSELVIYNYDTDRIRSKLDMDPLCEHIIDAFNDHMKRKNVVVNVAIVDENGDEDRRVLKPVDYTGVRLETVSYPSQGKARTTIGLYLAKPSGATGLGKPKGKIKVVTATGYGINLKAKLFGAGTSSCIMKKELLADLMSGIFEGEIRLGEDVKLEPSRRWFLDNEALYAAVDDIENWVKTVGSKHIQKRKDEEQNARYARYAQASAKVFRTFLREHPDLEELIKNMPWGHIGRQHFNTPDEKDGEISAKSIDGTGEKKKKKGDKKRNRNKPKKEKKDHVPIATGGPESPQNRRFVRNNSPGLILVHGTLPTANLWSLDEEKGIITINLMHPTWERCDRTHDESGVRIRSEKQRDKLICDLQERVMVQAIVRLKLKHDLKKEYGDNLERAHEVSIEEILLWTDEAGNQYMRGDLFLISEADRLTERGAYVDRVGKERRARQARKKQKSQTGKVEE